MADQLVKVIGTVRTQASDNLITDSAASATAFGCGVKTYNGGSSSPGMAVSIQPVLGPRFS